MKRFAATMQVAGVVTLALFGIGDAQAQEVTRSNTGAAAAVAAPTVT